MRCILFAVGLLATLTCGAGSAEDGSVPSTAPSAVSVRRLDNNPIIRPDMLPGADGANINGPSLIRVPAWIGKPLGRYYLYFAHHNGKYIRLACADRLEGPWRIHPGGTLRLADAPACRGHIASPDVHVDDQRRQIRMYFHGPAQGKGQVSFVAVSADGLSFRPSEEILGSFYFRCLIWDGWWYAMAKGGLMYRSKDGLTGFERGPNPFPGTDPRETSFNAPGSIRHVALHLTGQTLWVYYTRIGDRPERILRSAIQLRGDWRQWRAGPAEEVLRPEMPWEGADLPLAASSAGAARGREHAVRDPAVFVEDGRVYLLYSVAGESGIAIAEVHGGR